MSYFNTKAGSVEEAVKGLSKDLNDSAYQDMFKKELEKSGKGIASMSPQEKKDFFNKIDKMYKAKNEDATDKDIDVFHKKLDKLVHKSFGHSSDEKKENIDEKASMAKMYTKKASNGDVEVFYRGRTKYGNDKQIGYYHKQGSKFVAYHDNSDDEDDFTQSDTYNDERSAQMTILQTAAKERVITEADNPYAVGMAAAMKQTGDKPPLKKSTITKAHDIAKSIEKDDKKEEVSEGGPGSGPQKGGAKKSNFTSAQIKQAYGILNDPRYKAGNYSGAVKTINKVSPGLADHPDVKNALKRANEDVEVEKLKEDVSKLIETHTFRAKPMNKKQKDADGEKEIINPVKDETGGVKEEKAKMSEQTAKNFDLYRSIHSVWSNAAEKIDEIKKESKYLKAEEEVEESKDQSTLAKPGDTDSAKEEKGKTMIKSQKTKVDMEPEVEYNK